MCCFDFLHYIFSSFIGIGRVKTCFKVFDCNDGDDGKSVVSMDNTLTCYTGWYTILAASVLVVWGFLPFVVTCCCLKKYKSKGEIGSDGHDLLQDHYDEDADFRIKYGWAITKYRIKMNDADEERLDWFQNIVDEEFIKETHSSDCKNYNALVGFVIVMTIVIVVLLGFLPLPSILIISLFVVISIVGISLAVSISVRCNCTGCCPACCGCIFVLNDGETRGKKYGTVTKTRGKKYGECCRCW